NDSTWLVNPTEASILSTVGARDWSRLPEASGFTADCISEVQPKALRPPVSRRRPGEEHEHSKMRIAPDCGSLCLVWPNRPRQYRRDHKGSKRSHRPGGQSSGCEHRDQQQT